VQFMTGAFERNQPGIFQFTLQHGGVLKRPDMVGGAVDNQKQAA
jgi:hypothetical protein